MKICTKKQVDKPPESFLLYIIPPQLSKLHFETRNFPKKKLKKKMMKTKIL